MPRIGRSFLAWRESRSNTIQIQREQSSSIDAATSLDEQLWQLATAGDAERAHKAVESVIAQSHGPLHSQEGVRAIEVWTETELSALHALGWLAHLYKKPAWRAHAFDVCRWHIEHTQPDNATNHPWSVYLFAALHETTGDDDARLYAETLVHNCLVTSGVPDPLSARILGDAADAIEAIDWNSPSA